MAKVVICGGSIIGLATAMLLARDGHEVTVLEADPAPPPERPAEAWEAWDRTGVAQFHQPHNLFPRVRHVLDDDLPGMIDGLVDAGCVWIDPIAVLPPTIEDRSSRPDDDRFRFVTGRRPVVEAGFARAAAQHRGMSVRRGTRVAGLRAGAAAVPGVPHVDGVILATGDTLDADLVVDASGRRTKLPAWLADLDGSPPHVESDDSGFVYHTRYFRGPELPGALGPPLMAIGTISVLTLPGDNDTWSVTIFGASADQALRRLRDPGRWTGVVRACPLQAHWLEGEPITDIVTMAGILDRYRRYVVDDQPVATGVVAVGDAWACTNPSAGRGLSVGLLHAQRLRDAARHGLDDPGDFVRRFDDLTEADVAPFYRNQIAADRMRIAEMDALRDGADPPPPDPLQAATAAAMAQDAEVFRGVMEVIGCLALPQEVFARPSLLARIEPFVGQEPMRVPGPDREQLLSLLA